MNLHDITPLLSLIKHIQTSLQKGRWNRVEMSVSAPRLKLQKLLRYEPLF